MSFSSGTFSLVAGNPVTTGTTISSTWANNTLSDIASGLTMCVLKDGTQTITANIPMANYRITGLGSGTARTDATNVGQVQDGSATTLTNVGGSANAVTASCAPAITAYVTGQRFLLKPTSSNSAATTLNVAGVGAGAVQWRGGALSGGELLANVPVFLAVTTTTPVFEIMGGPPYAAFRNLLINPDGGIDQIGIATATADDNYICDGWYVLTQTATVTPSALATPEDGYPQGRRITQSNAVAQRFGFAQIVERWNSRRARGKTVTFTPRIRSTGTDSYHYAILEWTGTVDSVTSDVVNDWTSTTYTTGNFFSAANLTVVAVGSNLFTLGGAWTTLPSLTGSVSSSCNNLICMVWSTNVIVQNDTLDWDFTQLEIGSAATPFEWRDYSERLAQCKRYLQVFYNNTTGLSPLAVGQSVTTQQAYITLPLDTQLRVPATGITVSAGTHFQLLTAAGLGVASTSVSFNQGTVNTVDVAVAIGTASLIAGNATRLAFTSSVGYLAVTGAQL